jgi:IS5 family transposase
MQTSFSELEYAAKKKLTRRDRILLEQHQLTESIFSVINAHLAEKGLFLREGTIVDAALIAAPPSTKNQTGGRDPDMHQSKKGKQWHLCHRGASA